SECPAGVLLAVHAGSIEHVRVHHSGAQDFHPPGALARRATRPLAETALDVHLGRRLRERKIAWPESGACRTEESRREMRERGLEIDEADSFVNGESLDLREHRC